MTTNLESGVNTFFVPSCGGQGTVCLGHFYKGPIPHYPCSKVDKDQMLQPWSSWWCHGVEGGVCVESYEVTPHERSLSHWESTLEGHYEMPVSSCLLLSAFWLIVQAVLVCPIFPSCHAVLVKCQSHGHLVLDRSRNKPVFHVRSSSWVLCCISWSWLTPSLYPSHILTPKHWGWGFNMQAYGRGSTQSPVQLQRVFLWVLRDNQECSWQKGALSVCSFCDTSSIDLSLSRFDVLIALLLCVPSPPLPSGPLSCSGFALVR